MRIAPCSTEEREPREQVADRIDRVHAHQQRGFAAEIALHHHEMLGRLQRAGIDEQLPLAALRMLDHALLHAPHEALGTAAMGDQVGDGAELQAVALREGDEIGQPRHRAVIVHDLADHARRVEPGQARDVDRGLGVPRAHQRAALARQQREDMARRGDVVARRIRG